MLELGSLARHAFYGVAEPGHHGAALFPAGVVAAPIPGASIVLVQARKGRMDALIERLITWSGQALDARRTRLSLRKEQVSARWAGPGRWLIIDPAGATSETSLAPICGDIASLVDQSDGRCALRLAGPKAAACLAKGVAIDLHPRAFRIGDSVPLTLAHLQVQLSKDGDAAFEIAGPRAAAGDLWHWLETSAAEFGLQWDDKL